MTERPRANPHPWSNRWGEASRRLQRGAQPWATARREAHVPHPEPHKATSMPGSDMFPDDEPTSGRSRPSVRRLGQGLLPMPKVATRDPQAAILTDPDVPEHKRLCWQCQHPVGRASDDTPAATTGSCATCGSAFNFRPTLEPGDLIADQYEIRGCIAHGGLGWIYLAIDHNVSDRWVVLKGLQNPQDFEAHVVALAERQFLSEMNFPGIVKIFNFVKHRTTRETPDGYIIMEFVGGLSLKHLLDQRTPERLPVAEALAYLMEVLPALDYLHSFGLAYNDLKPDNIMVSEDEVKLIDLGAVAAMDSYGAIYGTPGFMAPEITDTGPTVASDIYTVGRTLAVLILPIAARTDELPDPLDAPLLQRFPSLHRLLRRALHPDPARRFPSAQAMYTQMAGVLRTVLAHDTHQQHPQISSEFSAPRGDFGMHSLVAPLDTMTDGTPRPTVLDPRDIVTALPVPLLDIEDPCADLLSPLLHASPAHVLDTLRHHQDHIGTGSICAPPSYAHEATLIAVRAHLDRGDTDTARDLLAVLRTAPPDWRTDWFDGVLALLCHDYQHAHRYFDTVHDILPGEITAALALAVTAELHAQGSNDTEWASLARRHYRTAWRTNHAMVSAAFGLARHFDTATQPLAAVAVLDEVPENSRWYSLARLSAAMLLVMRAPAHLTAADLHEAAERARAHSDDPRALPSRVLITAAALAWLHSTGEHTPASTLFGSPMTDTGLRRELENGLRALAATAPNRWHRYNLVDLANLVRPRTWW
ncbi:serine/threonine-protein kinase [Nocardia acididurans]|nr:serine/threonine-protein kinase [Nocardia acididurans]